MSFKVEKDWITPAGFRAVVIMSEMGHRCGYVGVPSGHSLHGVSYNQSTPALARVAPDTRVGSRGAITVFCAQADDNGTFDNTPELTFDVHGSLTFASGHADYPVPHDGLWWFGFDCAHAGDETDIEAIEDPVYRQHKLRMQILFPTGGVVRDLYFVTQHCESLADQIKEKVIA